MTPLDKSKKALTEINEKGWMNYSLELPSVYFMYMKTFPAKPMTEALLNSSEILADLENLDASDFTVYPLLHVEGRLRIENDVSLIFYKFQPFMVIQTVNGGVTGERLLSQGTYIGLGANHPPKPGSFIIPERIRYFMDDTFTISASSDHILVFDGVGLYSTSTDELPLLNE